MSSFAKLLPYLAGAVGGGKLWWERTHHPERGWGDALGRAALWGGGSYVAGRAGLWTADTLRRHRNPDTFVSHHHAPDGAVKEALAEVAESGELGFRFRDTSVTKPIKSTRPDRIRADLTRRVRQSDQLVVVVGKQTHRRPYVRHEIRVAKEAGIPVVAVKRGRSCKSPPELLGNGTRWAMSLDPKSIRKALRYGSGG